MPADEKKVIIVLLVLLILSVGFLVSTAQITGFAIADGIESNSSELPETNTSETEINETEEPSEPEDGTLVSIPVETINISKETKTEPQKKSKSEKTKIATEPIETLTQHQAIVGQPVKWTKKVVFDSLIEDPKIKVHKEANKIIVENTLEKTKISSEKVKTKYMRDDVSIAVVGISGDAVYKGVNLWYQLVMWFSKLGFGITGFATNLLQDQESMDLVITDQIKEIEINYETPAPEIFEEDLASKKQIETALSKGKDSVYAKRIIVSSDTHYENILASTDVPETKNSLTLYQINGEYLTSVEFKKIDTNNNDLTDKIEWTVPHLSEEEFLVEITSGCSHWTDICECKTSSWGNWQNDTTYNIRENLTDMNTTDMEPCLHINASNVTINCNGYTITGNESDVVANYWGTKEIDIRNCFLQSANGGGINFGGGANDSYIINTIIEDANGAGIYAQDSADLSLYNVTVNNSQGPGIYLAGAYNAYLSNVSVWNSTQSGLTLTFGSLIDDCNFTDVENSEFVNNSEKGIEISDSYHVDLTNVTCNNNTEQGVYLLDAGEVEMENLTLFYNNIGYESAGTKCSSNQIRDSEIYNNSKGVYVKGDWFTLNNTIIANNTGQYGLYLKNSNNSVIKNSLIEDNTETDTAWDFIIDVVTGFWNNTMINLVTGNATYSFQHNGSLKIKSAEIPDHPTLKNTRALNLTNDSATAQAFLKIYYESEHIADMDEPSLEIQRYNGTNWAEIDESGVNTTYNFAYAFIEENFSIFSIVGLEGSGDDNATPDPYCGDGSCNGAETCSSCQVDCGACPAGGGGGGGTGGGGFYLPPEEEIEALNLTNITNITNIPPTCVLLVDKLLGCLPLSVNIVSNSTDLDNGIATTKWSVGNLNYSGSLPAPMIFEEEGQYPVTMVVTDNNGSNCSSSATLTVKNCTTTEILTEQVQLANLAVKKAIKRATTDKETPLTEKISWFAAANLIFSSIGASLYLLYGWASKPIVSSII